MSAKQPVQQPARHRHRCHHAMAYCRTTLLLRTHGAYSGTCTAHPVKKARPPPSRPLAHARDVAGSSVLSCSRLHARVGVSVRKQTLVPPRPGVLLASTLLRRTTGRYTRIALLLRTHGANSSVKCTIHPVKEAPPSPPTNTRPGVASSSVCAAQAAPTPKPQRNTNTGATTPYVLLQ